MTLPALAPRPAPRSQPPFDEPRQSPLHVVHPSAQQLPLEADLTGRARDPDGSAVDTFFGPQPTPSRELPSPTLWSRRFVQAVAEVLAGLRAVGQLRASAVPLVYERLRLHAQRRRPGGRAVSPPMVQSVRVCEPADGVAEVAAVVRHGERFQAVAVRIEGIDGAWRCVSLRLL